MRNVVFYILSGLFALGLFGSSAVAQPDVKVVWANAKHDAIRIDVIGRDESSRECLGAGFEVHYRFELQLCAKTALWFDSCSPIKKLFRSVQSDPIGETYKVMTDISGDVNDPNIEHLAQRDESIEKVSSVPLLPLNLFQGEYQNILASSHPYMSVRVISSCKGEYNETVSKISYFLSLGLIRISGFNSGWIDFSLAPTSK